jgi:hypothetical protein
MPEQKIVVTIDNEGGLSEKTVDSKEKTVWRHWMNYWAWNHLPLHQNHAAKERDARKKVNFPFP